MSRKVWIPLAVFVAVTLSMLIPRIGVPYAWSDTDTLMRTDAITSIPLRLSWLDTPSVSRYLPLTRSIQATLITSFPDSPIAPTALQSIVWGVFALMVYLLVMELTRSRFASLGSALLVSFSLPCIQMVWITLHQTVALVELVIVLGLYGYVKYQNTGRRRWLYLLLGCSFVGPFVRELAIILPMVVIITTIVEKKWDRKLLIPLSPLLLHNIFPSTLPSLFLGKLIAIPVFARGVPEIFSFLSLSSWTNLSSLRLDMPIHLTLFVPPILTAFALLSAILFLREQRVLRAGALQRTDRKGLVLTTIILALGFASLFFTNMKYATPEPTLLFLLPSLLCLIVAIVTFPSNKLLTVWFAVSCTPFLRIYNAIDVSLIAPAIPWTIIMMVWIAKLPTVKQLSRTSLLHLETRHLIQCITVLLLLVVGFASQPLNLLAARSTFNGITSATKEMANWMAANIPKNSIIITNLIHGVEFKYYANNTPEPYYTFGHHNPVYALVLPDPSDYNKLVEEQSPYRDIYMVTGLTLTGGRDHWLINQPNETVELQVELQTVCKYPVLDILRCLLPPNYRPYGGPPDLAPEVQIDTGLFYQEARAEYAIYKWVKNEQD